MAGDADILLIDARSPRARCAAIEHPDMQPATLARRQQVGVMPRYGAAGLGGNPNVNTLLGRRR